MHIRLILSETLPPVTGAAIYDHRIAAALRAQGHTVEITSAREPAVDGATLIDDSALLDVPAALLDGVTALVHHPHALETEPPDAALKAREAAIFAAVRHIVTTSDQTADVLVGGFGVPRERITPIMPGIEDLPRSPGSGGPACRILCLAQLIPRKGQDVLLRAMVRLFDLSWHLTLAGGANDPAYADSLHALVEELGFTGRVDFPGEVTGEPLEALWRSTDLFALTSHYEGYGMVVAEALRRGLPVVATGTGAAPTLIAPETGCVCAPGEVDQISKSLRRLIFDKVLRRDMAEAAWQASRTLPSWDDQATKLAYLLA